MSVIIPIYKVKLVRERTASFPSDIVREPKVTAAFFHNLIGSADREHFAALFLDVHERPTGASIIGVGTLTSVMVHVREVFKAAILASAKTLIVCHNHPGGVPVPSAADLRIIRRLSAAGRYLDIPVRQHLIVTPSGTFACLDASGLLSAGGKAEAA